MTEHSGPAAMERLRRILSYQVSVAALIEIALWLAIPYLTIGLVWAFLHAGQVGQIEGRLSKVLPAGANVAALSVTAAFWPVSMQIANACPAP